MLPHLKRKILKGLGSDTLEKLRGRSRSELPSPESEDISRRRDSRKGQQVPVSGLSSLAKTYADEEGGTENNKQASTEVTKSDGNVASEVVLGSQAKDNNHQAKGSTAKEAAEKDKESVHHASKDKQTVNKTLFIAAMLIFLLHKSQVGESTFLKQLLGGLLLGAP